MSFAIFKISAIVVLSLLCLLSSASGLKWVYNMRYCIDSVARSLLVGDFNGDSRTDLLCTETSSGHQVIAFSNNEGEFSSVGHWQGEDGWCFHDGAELHVGDFNGDDRDDLLCHDTNDGTVSLAHSNAAGNFASGTTWEGDMGWCYESGAELHLGDFNGDGKIDMLCHYSTDGRKEIALADSDGTFGDSVIWMASLAWCFHEGTQLHVGDFNYDQRDDLLCQDTSVGNIWITYANADGHFSESSEWGSTFGWCYMGGARLYTGDVNDDGRDDLICHNTGDGSVMVAYANFENNFSSGTSWEGCIKWCFNADSQFFLGDYNGDGKVDMLCHFAYSGYKHVTYSNQPYE